MFPALNPIQVTDTGYIRIMAGPGYPTIPGDGRLSIMDAGTDGLLLDGYGYPIMNGVRAGFIGEARRDITAGRQWDMVTITTITEIIIAGDLSETGTSEGLISTIITYPEPTI